MSPRSWHLVRMLRRAGLSAVVLLLVVFPTAALACETYVVGALVQTGPHAWQMQAVIEAVVTRVDAASPDLVDSNPVGYQLTVRRVLRGAAVPRTIETVRAAGCDTIHLAVGDAVVIAVGRGVDMATPRGADPGGIDNYNSAWYRAIGGGGLRLVERSAWLPGLDRSATVGDVLRVAATLPPTDVAIATPTSAEPVAVLVAAAGFIGLIGGSLGLRRRSRRADRSRRGA